MTPPIEISDDFRIMFPGIHDLCQVQLVPDHKSLLELAHARMYFGKFKGRYLSELPENYLLWFRQKGFPAGKTGAQLEQVLELKMNGMEDILRTIRRKFPLQP